MSKFTLIVLVAVVACAMAMNRDTQRKMLLVSAHQGNPTYDTFRAFKAFHNKHYSNYLEELRRFRIFQDNMKIAKVHQDLDQGTAEYGATQFADMMEAEFGKYVSSKPWPLNGFSHLPKAQDLNIKDTPATVDWRTKGAVTPVKNQGQCGSCWSFSTTGNIEGQWFLKHGTLYSLSEQELVDCDHNGDQGCEGGLPSQAYVAIAQLGGLELEKDYPYTASDDTCVFDKSKVVLTVSGGIQISQDETQMAAWCAANGPMSIGINANAMQYYMGGVAHPWSFLCSPNKLDHGVLITGFGTDGSKPFWWVKNSWGASWGESGYYRVYRGKGVCGLNKMVTSATL